MHAREQLVPRGLPRGHAARERRDVAISEAHHERGGALRKAIGIVDQYDACRTPRHQHRELELEPAEGQGCRKEQMAPREDALLAHVEQRQLAAVTQHRFHLTWLCRGHALAHRRRCHLYPPIRV